VAKQFTSCDLLTYSPRTVEGERVAFRDQMSTYDNSNKRH